MNANSYAVRLRCEYLENPLAIDSKAPRLCWEMASKAFGAKQTAYQILASSSLEELKKDNGNLWDSGKVNTAQSLHIPYRGKNLKSYLQVFWKVRIWNETGDLGKWSKVSSFTMGILERHEWKAKFIGTYLATSPACPLLRKEFSAKSKIRRALLHVTSKGLHHLTLNGKDVCDEVLTPGWTDFNKRMHYRCYEVKKLLKPSARNCIGAELAKGWFQGRITAMHMGSTYGHRLGLLAQLRIEYEDGSVETLLSDETWKTSFGPTRRVDLYDGEEYDAQLLPRNWNRPDFDDSRWEPVFLLKQALQEETHLLPYPAEPVRPTEELKPIKFWSVAPGKVIYDFGQNFAGWVRLQFEGKAGTTIRLRFGEMINEDKSLYIDNMRSAASTDTYVMSGRKRERWEPKFTFHGFRYVEVTGCPVPPSISNVMGIVVGSDTPRVGHFHCSDKLVNQIYSNAVWTQKANFLEVPTDCPQRDERLGWTGDAQVFIRTAIANMDVAAFFTKWMGDLLDAQYEDGSFPNIAPDVLKSKGGAAWGDAGVVCPWTLYQCYEDKELLERMFPAMKKWVARLKKQSRGHLVDGMQCFGDWLSINAETPKPLIMTAHYAHVCHLTAKAADALGKKSQSKKLFKLFREIRKAFNKAYVKKNGKIEGDTQTAYLMALKFELLEPKVAKKAALHLVKNIQDKDTQLSTGFIGTALIMSVLRDTGHLDLAYQLLTKTSFPSWGYSVVNGATTIWERWNGWTKENGPGDVTMNSYSHYAYGAVAEWMFDTIAGIDHLGAGFQHFSLKPQPGGKLKNAEASYHSPYGLIRSSWKIQRTKFNYEVTIPANTQATIELPTDDLTKVSLDGKPLSDTITAIKSNKAFILPAGEYQFSWTIS